VQEKRGAHRKREALSFSSRQKGCEILEGEASFFGAKLYMILREGKNGVRKQKFNKKEKTEGFQRQYRYFCTEKIAKG